MRNVTIVGNLAQAGSGALAGLDGGSATGGGLDVGFFNGTLVELEGITVADNQVVAGEGADGFADGTARGGGFWGIPGRNVELVSSILSGNEAIAADGTVTPDDCFASPSFTSLGYNLVQAPDASCVVAAVGDRTGLDPDLYSVDRYGGCVGTLPDGSCLPTAAIDQSSPAADAGSCAGIALPVDARGLPRPFDLPAVTNDDDGCDIGAFEAFDDDGDGFTEASDCDPDDPGLNVLCLPFADGFESGDTSAWAMTVP